MKKIILHILLLLFLASCEDKLDIIPKGQTVLNTLEDLANLLNQEYNLGTPMEDLCVICNESYSFSENVNLILSQPNTLAYAYLSYDEDSDRAGLTTESSRYAAIYQYINYMNVIIDKIDDMEGENYMKEQVKAEAHIMRAYMHWLAVNIYAKQYDETTATKEGGIAYVTDLEITNQKTKLTLSEVYENILADCDEKYINALPDKSPNVTRAGKAWGYAVRAKVLMKMKKYEDALPYALKSIEYQNNIEDRSVIVELHDWYLEKTAPNNLIYIGGMISPFCEVLSIESAALFEPGDYVKDYAYMFGMNTPGFEVWNPTYGESNGGVKGALFFYGMSSYTNIFGITTERMYYTAAECYIRTDQVDEGLDLVNAVREYRIHPDSFEKFEASTEEEAMALLQKAKWIECISTYENFFDCKRWNSEEKYKRTITRQLPAGTYSIEPDSPLWVFPFPANAVRYNSSLTQNY